MEVFDKSSEDEFIGHEPNEGEFSEHELSAHELSAHELLNMYSPDMNYMNRQRRIAN